MFKKQALIWLSVILFVCLVATFVACDPTPQKYTVTYVKGNENATGTAPEVKEYAEGDTVTVAENPFVLDKYEFAGWKSDDATYQKGDTFKMPAHNVTLTAQWDEKTSQPQKYTVTYVSGNENATGTAPQVKEYAEGDEVTTESCPFVFEEHVFDRWQVKGEQQTYQVGDKFDMPAHNIVLEAKWIGPWSQDLKTVAEILEQIPAESTSADIEYKHFVKATVKSIDNATYGEMTIEDETGSISVYGTRGADGYTFYDKLDEKPYAGDTVVLYIQTLANFKGTKEIKLAWIVHFEKAETPPFDINDYAQANVSEARAKNAGEKVVVEGVVARITYANGKKPSGFFLVDGTDSIYVYDSQIAPQVKVGDKVRIAGERDNWILADEASNAQKFGYTGCLQLANAYLVEKLAENVAVDFSWVEESTVKRIMDTPASENITTTIFKVNALVQKSEQPGFINYYIDDIDGKTGSYVYTQCNGSDFDWLDEFDGKICTVYLSVINAKSTATGCVWRFVPIQVSYENYVFDKEDAPQFAIDYFGVGQFQEVYQSDPALEVTTTVSSELLGIEGVTLSYSSDNEQAVKFVAEEGKTVMHTLQTGTAHITITASYKSYPQKTATVTVTVAEKPHYDAITVAEAIATAVNTEVTVRGIVGPSLVNQIGFYLIDDTGTIAVRISTKEACAELSLGDEVVIKATRATVKKNDEATTYFGQTCLDKAEVLLNEYGDHEYCTDNFVHGKTLSELRNADPTQDFTTTIYVLDVKVNVIETNFYTSINIGEVDGDVTLSLYCSGAGQYEFLKQFSGQTVTVELALCNWNGKTYYAGCVLSATDSEGNTVYNQLNLKK